jgi:general secretion pathway protein D
MRVTSLLLVSALITSSCAEVARELDSGRRDRGVMISEDPIRPTLGLEDSYTEPPSVPEVEGATRVELLRGSGTNVRSPSARAAGIPESTSEEPVSVNFPNTDIREVARTVLGDLYGLPYSIDPAVQGQITFETSAPIPKSKFLATFETVLRINGFALIRQGEIYTIVPLTEAPARGHELEVLKGQLSAGVGFRQLIVPLKFVSPDEIRRVLEPMAPQGGILLTDNARGVIILSGTRSDLESMLEVIEAFDTDWMSSMSFAILTPANVDAATLARELNVVFDNPKNPARDLVDLVPLQRLNGVLAISSEPDLLDEVSRWARRLDRRAVGGGRQIFYYRVQNAKAGKMLESLAPVMGLQSEGDAAATQAVMEPAAPPATDMQGSEAAPQPQAPEVGVEPASPTVVGSETGPKISADEHNNALVILATAQEYALLEDALRQMDTLPLQVLIEATIAEVTLNDRLAYGVQWFFESGKETFKLSEDDGVGDLIAKFPGFSFAHISPNTQVVINALSSVTDVDVVSSPRIMALTNQPALIQVGDQVPIITQSAVSVQDPDAPIVNSVEMRDTGVILRVTPRINNSGLIVLDVEQEVSDVVETTSSDLNTPTIQQRRIKSTVAVRDGETAILGGLIRNSLSDGRSGIPFLKDIPAIGELFSSTNSVHRRTELLVFLKPRVVASSEDARMVMDELTGEVKSLQVRRLPRAIRKP